MAWIARLKRPPKAEDLTHGSLSAFREYVRLGVDPSVLLAAIEDRGRDGTEYLWQFKNRVVSPRVREPTKAGLLDGIASWAKKGHGQT